MLTDDKNSFEQYFPCCCAHFLAAVLECENEVSNTCSYACTVTVINFRILRNLRLLAVKDFCPLPFERRAHLLRVRSNELLSYIIYATRSRSPIQQKYELGPIV